MTAIEDALIKGFKRLLREDGRSVTCSAGTFQALIDTSPQLDIESELGQDSREIAVIETLREGCPNVAYGAVLADGAAQWRVLKRDNNFADITVKFTAEKVI